MSKKLNLSGTETGTVKILSQYILNAFRKYSMPVVVCIGSDRVTGDCLGPLVGHFLTEVFDTPAFVYGTLSNTVTAANLNLVLPFIKSRHSGQKILVVDASVGTKDSLGIITASKGSILPGSGCGKVLPEVGDYSITAVVAESSATTYSNLQNTKLSFVYSLAASIAGSIHSALSLVNALIMPAECISELKRETA